jgi:hypothetical protein
MLHKDLSCISIRILNRNVPYGHQAIKEQPHLKKPLQAVLHRNVPSGRQSTREASVKIRISSELWHQPKKAAL